jgi:hypothetical protein
MKNILKGLLFGIVLVSGTFLADRDTNLTFLAGRPIGVNLAMERPTWHTQIHHRLTKEDDMFGAAIQATGFYEANTNGNDLGRYFGFNNDRSLVVGTGNTTGIDLDRTHFIQRLVGTAGTPLSGTINLEFDHQAAGVRLDYQQDLDCLLKGLYFKISTAIIWEENDSNLNVSSSVTQSTDISGTSTNAASIADYFAGRIVQIAGANEQAGLLYAKIDGSNSEVSLADIDLLIGWSFYETDKHHAGINVAVTFPTSPDPDMYYLFESTGGGNRGHWALGAGFDGKATLWNKDDQALELQAVFNWRYLFESSEKRTFGVNSKNWGQYMMIGTSGSTGVQPLANVSTLNTDITPGHQIDFLTALSYLAGGFTFDLFYNLFYKEGEDADRKDRIAADTYAFAGWNYDANVAFNATGTDIATGTPTIANRTAITSAVTAFLADSDLDTASVETPDYLTHKIGAGLGYAFNNWDTPLMLGLGGWYEFGNDQETLEKWGIDFKIGIAV